MAITFTPITEAPVQRPVQQEPMTAPVQRRLQLKPIGMTKADEDLGELEFLADLANSGSQDDLAKLGTKVAGASIMHNNLLAGKASYYPTDVSPSLQTEFKAFEGKFPSLNTIYTGVGRSVPAVQNHEFRHAGVKFIVENFTAEHAEERWGDEAGHLITLFKVFNEASVEVFDNPEDFAGMDQTMQDTIQFLEQLTPSQKELVQRVSEDIAQDIMGDLGVPPRTQRREPESEDKGLFDKFLTLFGG